MLILSVHNQIEKEDLLETRSVVRGLNSGSRNIWRKEASEKKMRNC